MVTKLLVTAIVIHWLYTGYLLGVDEFCLSRACPVVSPWGEHVSGIFPGANSKTFDAAQMLRLSMRVVSASVPPGGTKLNIDPFIVAEADAEMHRSGAFVFSSSQALPFKYLRAASAPG